MGQRHQVGEPVERERRERVDLRAGEPPPLLEQRLVGLLQAAIDVRHGGDGHDGGA